MKCKYQIGDLVWFNKDGLDINHKRTPWHRGDALLAKVTQVYQGNCYYIEVLPEYQDTLATYPFRHTTGFESHSCYLSPAWQTDIAVDVSEYL